MYVSASSNPLNQTKAQSLLQRFAPPTKLVLLVCFDLLISFFLNICTTQQRQGDCGTQSLLSSLPATICSTLIRRYNSSKHRLPKGLHCFVTNIPPALKFCEVTDGWRPRWSFGMSHHHLPWQRTIAITIYLDRACNCGQRQTMELDIPIWSASVSLGLPTTFRILEQP